MMKKVILNNLYQSSLPPNNKSVLWTKLDNNGDIISIFKYDKDDWVPYLISAKYMLEDKELKTNRKEKIEKRY